MPRAFSSPSSTMLRRLETRIAPHDLRRTYARLAHKGKAPIEQIQLSLAHASLVTSQRYVGVQQDLTDAPCDHLGLRLSNAGGQIQPSS